MQGQYSLARAQQSFKSLVQIHEKNGKQKIAVKFLIKQKQNVKSSFHPIRICFIQVGSHHRKRTDNAAQHEHMPRTANIHPPKPNSFIQHTHNKKSMSIPTLETLHAQFFF